MQNGISLFPFHIYFFSDSTFGSSLLCPHNYIHIGCLTAGHPHGKHTGVPPTTDTNWRIHCWHGACLNLQDTRVPLFLLQPQCCQHAATHLPIYYSVLLQPPSQSKQQTVLKLQLHILYHPDCSLASCITLSKKPSAGPNNTLCWTVKTHRACSLHLMMPTMTNSLFILMVF